MSRTRYRIFENEYPYFMTCTIVGWQAIFTRPEAVEIVYDSWRHLQQEKQFQLYGYVILENHLHLIAGSPQTSQGIQRFKSCTARRIIDHLQAVRAERLLELLALFKRLHKT